RKAPTEASATRAPKRSAHVPAPRRPIAGAKPSPKSPALVNVKKPLSPPSGQPSIESAPRVRVSEVSSLGLLWKVTRGNSPLDIGQEEIHLVPGEGKDGPLSAAEARLEIQSTSVWRVSFEARFGQLAALGTGLVLEC